MYHPAQTHSFFLLRRGREKTTATNKKGNPLVYLVCFQPEHCDSNILFLKKMDSLSTNPYNIMALGVGEPGDIF